MNLLLIKEGKSHTIYSMEIGKSVSTFLESLKKENSREYVRIIRRLEHLADNSATRRRSEFNALNDGLFEAKTRGGVRIIFFYDDSQIIIAALGFIKKQQKTPKTRLSTASERKKAYESQKLSGTGFTIMVPGNMPKPRRQP